MKIETYVSFSSEIRIITLFKNLLTNYMKSNILTKILVLLLVDSDDNGVLFAKQLRMVNEIIDYS